MAKLIEIDIDRVRQLAARGLTEEQIAVSLGVSRATIGRRKQQCESFERAIKEGRAKGVAAVTNALFEAATNPEKPNVSAMIFYLKNRGGWSDTHRLEGSVDHKHDHEHRLQNAMQTLVAAGVDVEDL